MQMNRTSRTASSVVASTPNEHTAIVASAEHFLFHPAQVRDVAHMATIYCNIIFKFPLI